ncbi:MAG: carotenoid cleavage dioxygenase-like enzyme, partial [Myxococcota bacterium]
MADRRLTRRRVLQRLGLSGAAVTLGPSLLACDDTSTTNLEPADIGPMLDSRPPTSVMAASTSEVDLTLQVLAGALPADLVGHVFVVAPVPNQSGASLLTGDGMVYRLDLGAKQVSLKSRFMRTPSYLVDQATRGTDDAFTTNGLARFSKTYGVRNYANTALVPLDTSRLLVTTDIGRPHLIDPVSLAVITPLGRNDEWRSTFGQTVLFGEAFPLAQTTAHPVWDARTDELFSVNYASPFLNGQETWTDLLRWQGDALERWPILDARTGEPAVVAQSMHQIGVTRRYVILMETAFVVRLNFTGQAQPITPQGSETPVWLIARADLDGDATSVQAHRIVLPSESVHFLADYEDADDLIRMHVCHNRASDPGVWLEPGDVRADTGAPVDERLHGLLGSGTDLVALGRHT